MAEGGLGICFPSPPRDAPTSRTCDPPRGRRGCCQERLAAASEDKTEGRGVCSTPFGTKISGEGGPGGDEIMLPPSRLRLRLWLRGGCFRCPKTLAGHFLHGFPLRQPGFRSPSFFNGTFCPKAHLRPTDPCRGVGAAG